MNNIAEGRQTHNQAERITVTEQQLTHQQGEKIRQSLQVMHIGSIPSNNSFKDQLNAVRDERYADFI